MTLIICSWVIAFYHRRFLPTFIFTVMILLTRYLWTLTAYNPITNAQIISAVTSFNLPTLITIWKYMLTHLLVYTKLPAITVLFTLLIGGKYLPFRSWIIWGIFWSSLLILVLAGSYIFAVNNQYWDEIGGSVERMGIVFIPLLYLFIHDILNATIYAQKKPPQ